MDLREFYSETGSDFEDVLRRLGTEERVSKFLLKLPADSNFALLESSLAAGKWEDAFRAVHSIKGICMNLSLTVLLEASVRLTENLRGGQSDENTMPLFEQLKKEYIKTMQMIAHAAQD